MQPDTETHGSGDGADDGSGIWLMQNGKGIGQATRNASGKYTLGFTVGRQRQGQPGGGAGGGGGGGGRNGGGANQGGARPPKKCLRCDHEGHFGRDCVETHSASGQKLPPDDRYSEEMAKPYTLSKAGAGVRQVAEGDEGVEHICGAGP